MDEMRLTQDERRLYTALMEAAQVDEALAAFVALVSRDQYAAWDDEPGPATLRALVRSDLAAWRMYHQGADTTDEERETALIDLLNGGICER